MVEGFHPILRMWLVMKPTPPIPPAVLGAANKMAANILQIAFPAPTAFLVTRLSNTAKFYSNKINFEARAPLLVLL